MRLPAAWARRRSRVAALAVVLALGLVQAGCGARPAAPSDPGPPAAPSWQPTGSPPAIAEGITFVRAGSAFVVREGRMRSIGEAGREVIAVGYSSDREALVIAEVNSAAHNVRLAPLRLDAGSGPVLAVSGELGTARATGASASVYYSVHGYPSARLFAADARDLASRPASIGLGDDFSGEFDVSSGGVVVYTGTHQNPASVFLRARSRSRPIVEGFATAFTPALSPDAEQIAFTGTAREGDAIALWVVDAAGTRPRLVTGSVGLVPTWPVFSGDGERIAFRSAADGTIWVASGDGTAGPTPTGVACDDAPLGW